MGEALAEMQKNEGGRPKETGDTMSPVSKAPTYAQLRIDKKEASRWQALAKIGSDMFEAILEGHERQGTPVTAESVTRTAERAQELGHSAEDIRNAPVPSPRTRERAQARFWSAVERASSRELLVEKFTGEYEWNTPPEILEVAREVLGEFDLDPASNPTAQKVVRARRYFTKEDDGLRPALERKGLDKPALCSRADRSIRRQVARARQGRRGHGSNPSRRQSDRHTLVSTRRASCAADLFHLRAGAFCASGRRDCGICP